MKRLLSLLALLLSAPVFAASDVVPTYPDLILQKNVTTVSTGSPQRTQPVAYQVVATGTGSTVSATVKIYCKTINLPWASGTQQGSDITLSASNSDVDSSVTVSSACPYLYSDVTAISATTVNVVATPMYSAASSTTNNAAGQYADDADFTDGTSVGVLSQGVAESASPTAVTEGDIGAAAITLNRAWKSSLYTPLGDSAMDDTQDSVKVTNAPSESNTSGTSSNVSATALAVGGAGVELIDGFDLGAVAASYCTLAITNSADGAIDAAKIYLLPSGETNLTAPNVIGGSTGTTSAHFTAPAVGSPLEWATSWVTATGVIGTGDLTTLAASSVWVGRLKVAGADKLYVEISGDGAVDTTYRLSCN